MSDTKDADREAFEGFCEKELICIAPLTEVGSPPHMNYTAWRLWQAALDYERTRTKRLLEESVEEVAMRWAKDSCCDEETMGAYHYKKLFLNKAKAAIAAIQRKLEG